MSSIIEFFSPKLIKPLVEKLVTLKRDREKDIHDLGDLFGDPEELARCYIEPNCQHVNPANEDEDEPNSVVESPVFKTVNAFLSGTFSVAEDGRNQMFVLSDAGMGKTSLLMMLQLAYLTSFWPNKYECVLLKLGNDSLHKIASIDQKSNTVLLLDALDEDPNSWGKVKFRLIQLLDATNNFRRVIITCRTQFFPNEEIDPFKRVGKIKIGNYVCPMFFLSLFDDEKVEHYLTKRYSLVPNSHEYINRAKSIILSMGSLRFRPLLLAHVEGFLESDTVDWNEYIVFETLTNTWLNREEKKLRQRDVPFTSKNLLRACVAVAAEMHDKGIRELSEKDLEKLQGKNKYVKAIGLIDVGGRSLLNKNSDNEYRFSHYSIQEFLVVHGINLGYITKNSTVRCTDKIHDFMTLANLMSDHVKKLNFKGTNLLNKIFIDLDLSGMDFSNAVLSGSNFQNSTLTEADFSHSALDNARFDDANMSYVNMSNTNATGASFVSCDLAHANLRHAILVDADFSGANLLLSDKFGAEIGNIILSKNTKFYESTLNKD